MEYGNITCIGLLSAFQHCYTNSLILLLLKARFKNRFQTLRKKQNNCDKSRECTLCKHPPTQVLMQPFQFLTLELWSPVAIGSKKQNDLRRVWQIQFDRFPHKTDFVFFLPMLCKKSVVRATITKVCWAKMVTWINIAGPIICVAIEEVWDLVHSTIPAFFISKNKTNIATGTMDLGVEFFHQSNCF